MFPSRGFSLIFLCNIFPEVLHHTNLSLNTHLMCEYPLTWHCCWCASSTTSHGFSRGFLLSQHCCHVNGFLQSAGSVIIILILWCFPMVLHTKLSLNTPKKQVVHDSSSRNNLQMPAEHRYPKAVGRTGGPYLRELIWLANAGRSGNPWLLAKQIIHDFWHKDMAALPLQSRVYV